MRTPAVKMVSVFEPVSSHLLHIHISINRGNWQFRPTMVHRGSATLNVNQALTLRWYRNRTHAIGARTHRQTLLLSLLQQSDSVH